MRRVILGVGILALAAVFVLHAAVVIFVVHALPTYAEFARDVFARYNVVAFLLTAAAAGATWLIARRRPETWIAVGLCLGGGAVLDFLFTSALTFFTFGLGD